MGLWATNTSFSHLMPYFLKGNTTGSDTFGAALLSSHIDRAEAKLASVLSRRYSMPFDPVPPEVRRITEDLTSYFVIRGSNYQDGKEKNRYLDEFKGVLDDIKELMSGERGLTYTDGSIVPVRSSTRMSSSTRDYSPIFGLDDPQSWGRDPNEIEAQAEARDE